MENLYNNTDGPNWTDNTNWLVELDHCSWSGVTCMVGGIVTDLDLSNNGLNGTLPITLGDLTSLSSLSLNNNQLTGSIPTELGNLSDMVYLYLYDNQLTGNIPSCAGHHYWGGSINRCHGKAPK